MISSTMPSAKYSCSGSPPMLVKGRTAMDGLSGNGGSSLFANARAGPSAHPCCDAYRFRRFIKLRYRRNKPVAAAGNSLDDRATVADRLADLADALCERLVSH